MVRRVSFNDNIIEYYLEYKKVKNINLRVKSDLSVHVSANRGVNLEFIDNFVSSKGDFILSAQEKITKRNNTEIVPKFTDEEFSNYIKEAFEYVKSLFSDKLTVEPTLKMRKMTSCWGTCNYVKSIITLNRNLIFCSKEQIFYVVVHEFAHLLVHNHSKEFYNIVKKYCENYKEIRKEMKEINLKRG